MWANQNIKVKKLLKQRSSMVAKAKVCFKLTTVPSLSRPEASGAELNSFRRFWVGPCTFPYYCDVR